MPVSSLPARHRSVARPTTFLSDLAETATGSLALGPRSAVVVACSGLLTSVFAVPASAAPPAEGVAAVHTVDTSALTAAARAVIDTAPVVTVSTDATWSLDLPALTVVADPPPKPSHVVPAAASRGAAAPASANGSAIIEIASRYIGVPYVWGGGTPNGFDCSGFTSYVYAQMGVSLPHSSAAQRHAGTVVSRADAQPGDLIVTPGHVAMYAGGNMLIDATPGNTIRFHSIYQSSPVFVRIG